MVFISTAVVVATQQVKKLLLCYHGLKSYSSFTSVFSRIALFQFPYFFAKKGCKTPINFLKLIYFFANGVRRDFIVLFSSSDYDLRPVFYTSSSVYYMTSITHDPQHALKKLACKTFASNTVII